MSNALVATANPDLARQVTRILSGEGLLACIADNAPSALEAIRRGLYQPLVIAVIDYDLPYVDGITWVRHLRTKHPQHANLPILMLAHQVPPELAVLGRECGIDSWLLRPLNETKVITAVGAVLAPEKPAAAAANADKY